MSNFTIDMGDPNFRTGAYSKYLGSFAKTLSNLGNMDQRYLLARHTLDSLYRSSQTDKIRSDNSFVVDYQRDIDVFGFGDEFIKKSYNDAFTKEEEAKVNGYFKALFGGWEPDLIICWEFPTTLFRKMFPKALVIDLMPGLFMRPPYPRTISLDPVGLYKDSVFSDARRSSVVPAPQELEAYYQIRNEYEKFYADNHVKESILSKLDGAERFEKFTLVPLQITNYFGFNENCKYKSQFDFLVDVLKNTPKDTGVIATQYVSGMIEEKAINDKNIDFLRDHFPNFLYSKEFEKIDNISQYIVPWADQTCSISSTIGLQSTFYNKELLSPSTSHLSYFASRRNLGDTSGATGKDNENIMAIMLNRQTFLESRLLNDSEYLAAILTEIKENVRSGKSGLDLLPKKSVVRTARENAMSYSVNSSYEAAVRQMGKIGIAGHSNNSEVARLVKKIRQAETVTFDVFDTLLCRAVFKPEDVFYMMEKELKSHTAPLLPPHVVATFAQLRRGCEQQLRRQRDHHLSVTKSDALPEELNVREVYDFMISKFGGNAQNVDRLIELEQELELSILRARPVGKHLFNEAIKAKKDVYIISDFIHDEDFVERALHQSGFTQYKKLFVSSKSGKKKHSGDLFEHVITDLGINPKGILHIGDNAVGDFQKAGEAGWDSVRISSSRERALEIFKNRTFSPSIVDSSFYLRTTLSLFAEEFYPTRTFFREEEVKAENSNGVITNGVEFGFLALGPVMYSFAEWIVEQALDKGLKSIVFFARDCYLPFKIAERIIKKRKLEEELSVHYIATSRKGVRGLNLMTPEDFLSIRIDDFARKNSFANLLESRFGLDSYTFSEGTLKSWGINNIDIEVGKLTPAAMYGAVYTHVKENWTTIGKSLDHKRRIYTNYLKQEGIDLDEDCLAIDFGYKGSIHKMISPMFKGKVHPAFFMTYADFFGQDPIEQASSYYLKNLNPNHKNTIMLSHNLIIETLVNESTGSLIEMVEDVDGSIRTIKEDLGSLDHQSKVFAIHSGVMKFADAWLNAFENHPGIATLESNSADYLLASVLRKPTVTELEIFKGLIFDNAFAGHKPKYILSPDENSKIQDSIWKEGYRVMAEEAQKEKNRAAVKKADKPVEKKPAPKPSPTVNKLAEKPSNTNVIKKNVPSEKPTGSKKKKPIKPVKLEGGVLVVEDSVYPLKINKVKVLHRDTFVEAISLLAKETPSQEAKKIYSNLIKAKSKRYVAAKILKDNGGISKSRLSGREKMKCMMSLVRKK